MVIDEDHFWLNINKDAGFSSAKIVAIIKKTLKVKKIGHAGTLDPIATGVLPIAVNRATKTIDYIQSEEKEYYAEIKWGEKRDTDDIEGKIESISKKRPTNLEILSVIVKFLGQIEQVPPEFSAIKVSGKRSYQLARDGYKPKLKSRLISIKEIRLHYNNQNQAGFFIKCSKGTYIRSFARDLAENIGSLGYIKTLKRLKVGNFSYDQTISLDKLKILSKFEYTNFKLRTIDILGSVPNIEVDHHIAVKISYGQKVSLPIESYNNRFVNLVSNGKLIAIMDIKIDKIIRFINQ
ncbi:tRNA pseudouridine(55) synthase TruB [Rickettsiales bacterium]|nr:tRNA pseudouridine(55) synthase TruB [Rickettsiales bacterium]MDB2550732.1 tRNA pseudouridine(55) synthase TruB [Rickettsiales bacterium]